MVFWNKKKWVLLVLVIVFVGRVKGEGSGCESEIGEVKSSLRSAISEKRDLIPACIRAAFHDCITATKDKAESGCNGSLRLAKERDNHRNDGLQDLLEVLDGLVGEGVNECVSYADGIQMSMIVALDFATNGTFPEIKVKKGIRDWDRKDTLSELPNRRASFEELKELFARKGLNSKDLVSSIVAAHSVGGFDSGADQRELNFTTTPFEVNVDYATNLVHRFNTGRNLAGFNTIPADRNLLESSEGVRLVKFFAGKVGSVDGVEVYDKMKGVRRIQRGFKRFLEKNSFLRGETLP